MTELLRPVNLVFLILGVGGLVWGIYSHYANKPAVQLSWAVESAPIYERNEYFALYDRQEKKIVESGQDTGDVRFYPDVLRSRVYVWNSGTVQIKPEDLRRPLTLAFARGGQLLKWGRISSHPQLAAFESHNEYFAGGDRIIDFDWKHFDPGFLFYIDVIHTGTPNDLRVDIAHVGEKPIAKKIVWDDDLPLNFHPAAVRASANVTPFGAVSVPAYAAGVL